MHVSAAVLVPRATTSSTSRPAAQQQQDPVPTRWSLTQRIFGLNLRSFYDSNPPRRPPASRLWNPVNSSPRTLALPNVPVQHPDLAQRGLPHTTTADARDEYPLLTLPEQRRSRQSPAHSSLVVERSTGGDSSRRTSIGFPRDRRSIPIEASSQPQTPGLIMPEQESASAGQRDHAHPVAMLRSNPTDPEMGLKAMNRISSRVSMPSRSNSMRSHRTGTADEDGDDDDNDSEFPWGPSHPCFPHPNPHVPLDSPLHESTRIIRIKRDWMIQGDLAPTFMNLYPEILEGIMTEDDFRDIVQKINDTLIQTFNPLGFRAWLDAFMGVATFWLWDDAGLTKVKKDLANLERWVETWNKDIGVKEGIAIIPLRRTGYLTLDIQIPDPDFEFNTSRPNTQQDDLQSTGQKHNDYGHYPLTPTLQVSAGSPIAIEAPS
ncbi:Golgin subfamily A member 7/ERF4 family-domain-containing protein [Dendryphion nanum]|uniref:Ras modification protein ERF4 n=1 Tax=Dendryphion nanum TaxID=256645 RepID=A0A9P9IJ64_9PLEO|nr:Golgin subfamily A member 7/ERF4 family-domain-containing protein [Dendryphion nanum]